VSRGRRFSASARVALAVTMAVAVGVLLLALVGYVALSRRMTGELDRALVSEAGAFNAILKTGSQSGTEGVRTAADLYLKGRDGGSSQTIVLVRFPDGSLVTNTKVALERAPGNQANLDPRTAARSLDTVAVGDQGYRVATVPLRDPKGRLVAVFQAALPTTMVEQIATDLLRILLLAGLLVILLAVALSQLVARTALRPLIDAARTARGITQSSLSTRVAYNGPPDDVGQLVQSLNDMLARLETAFGEQRRFVADASHELRTPLTIIQGHLDVMREEGSFTAEEEESFDLISSEVRRMTALVVDLLALARLEAGPPRIFQELDLAEVVEDAVVMAHALGDRRIVLRQSGVLWLRGDRDLLLQALLVLMNNAVNHTEEGGTIRVTTAAAYSRVTVSVADDGPGIPEGDLDRIFDRFYRAPGTARPSAGGGSGLGLTIARRLIALHGGQLTAGNDPDGGAVFSFTLRLLVGRPVEVAAVDIDLGCPGSAEQLLPSA
jgi:two-component system OmpR family sensor kinase